MATHYYKIDGNGNIIMGSDTASTASTHFTKILVAMLQNAGFDVHASQQSQIRNISYDPTNHRLEWDDVNQTGRQNVEIQNASLIAFLNEAYAYQGSMGNLPSVLSGLEDRIKTHVTTEHVSTREHLMLNGFVPLSGTVNTIDSKIGSVDDPGSVASEVSQTIEMVRNVDTNVNWLYNAVLSIIDERLPALATAIGEAPRVLVSRLRKIEGLLTWLALPRTAIKQEVRGLMRFLASFWTRDEKWTSSEHLPKVAVGESKRSYTNPPSARYPFVMFGKKTTIEDKTSEADVGGRHGR